MNKSKIINKRTHSVLKPFFYLFLQVIAIIELFAILNGSFNIALWSFAEQCVIFLFFLYFVYRTYVVVNRTNKIFLS